jgi:hypothetical protein
MKRALFFTVILTTLLSNSFVARAEILHLIFTEPEVRSRAPASAWPEELAADFAVEEPSNREPASIIRRAKSKGKAPTKSQVATGRRSRLPSFVQDGFEIRVKAANLVTTFWVVKRGDKYDLLYANSAGSRASVSLSPESFHAVQSQAARIPASETNVKKCADSMQLLQVSVGTKERASTFCLNSKAPAAEQLRMLGNTLVVWVR